MSWSCVSMYKKVVKVFFHWQLFWCNLENTAKSCIYYFFMLWEMHVLLFNFVSEWLKGFTICWSIYFTTQNKQLVTNKESTSVKWFKTSLRKKNELLWETFQACLFESCKIRGNHPQKMVLPKSPFLHEIICVLQGGAVPRLDEKWSSYARPTEGWML